jgi:hypothetical protein
MRTAALHFSSVPGRVLQKRNADFKIGSPGWGIIA